MSTGLISPGLFVGQKNDQQHAADLQRFYRTNILPEVLRFYLPTVNASNQSFTPVVLLPIRAGVIQKLRAWSGTQGSGSFDVYGYWIDNLGGSHNIFASSADWLHLPSVVMVEATATGELYVDPNDVNKTGRITVKTANFTGTAWGEVVVEVVLQPMGVF